MIKETISKLVKGKNLNFNETKEIFEEIFTQRATDSQIAAFLSLLKVKGETQDEISAAAVVVRAKAVKLDIKKSFLGIDNKDEPVIDTCGTGGSGLNKFNVSTATSFVVAAIGVKVAKHGNKAMSSSCGSADVLKALGVNIEASTFLVQEVIKKVGIGFLYAPLYHSALGKVAAIRREIGIRTIFNILGPLCNPAFANFQLLGVYEPNLTLIMAKVLKKLGTKRAFVVYGQDVCDEISLTGKTRVSFLNNNKITSLSLTPSSFGLKKIKLKDIIVKDAASSAKMISGILAGKKGAPRDMVLANSAACFYILGKTSSLKRGVQLAVKLIDEGKAKGTFLKFKNFLQKNA